MKIKTAFSVLAFLLLSLLASGAAEAGRPICVAEDCDTAPFDGRMGDEELPRRYMNLLAGLLRVAGYIEAVEDGYCVVNDPNMLRFELPCIIYKLHGAPEIYRIVFTPDMMELLEIMEWGLGAPRLLYEHESFRHARPEA